MANSVEPIREIEKIKEISEYLKVSTRHGQRNQLMFLMGINFGLRILLFVKYFDTFIVTLNDIDISKRYSFVKLFGTASPL